LLLSHQVGEIFKACRGAEVTGCSCARIPRIGGNIVEREASATFVESGEIGFGSGITLMSSESKPMRRLGEIPRNAVAFAVQDAKCVLSGAEIKIGRSPEPVGRFGGIAWSADARRISNS
jgi:hypothetical protein